MAPISIDFLANVQPFLRGTKDVEGALDEVGSSLDELARDGGKSGDVIGDSMKDAGREARQAGDVIGDSMKDAGREARQAGDAIGDSMTDASREARRAGDAIGDSMTDASREARRAGDAIGDSMTDAARDARRAGDAIGDSMTDAARDTKRAGDDMEDSLEAVSKEARKTGDDIGERLQDGAREGATAVERIEDSFSQMAKKVKAESKSAGDDLGDNIKRGAQRAEQAADEASQEIRDEFKSNLSEVTSSFRGDVESLGDLAQGTLGGLVGGLGPLGLAIGAAGAAAIGLVIGATERSGEATEAQKARVQELTAAYIEAGNRGELSYSQVADKLKELATTTDDQVLSLSKLNDISDQAESSFRSIAQAYAGSTDDLDRLIKKEQEHKRSLEEEAAAIDTTAETSYGAAIRRADDQQKLVDALSRARDEAKRAAEEQRIYLASGAAELQRTADAAEDYADRVSGALSDTGLSYEQQNEVLDRQIAKAQDIVRSYDDMVRAAKGDESQIDSNLQSRARWAEGVVANWEQVKLANIAAAENEKAYAESGLAELDAKAERTAEYADSIQSELADVGESWEKYQNAETGAIDLEAYTAALTARVQAMDNYRANMSTLHGTISEDAYNYLVQMGADAAPLIDAYVKAPLDQQQKTAEVWGTLGRTGGQSYNTELQNEIPDSLPGPDIVIPSPDMSPVERAIQQFGTRRIVVNVEGRITKIGQQVYD